ncbi:uncharacterized protein EHS24_001668 [Apiotrichum porosum]|uniref:Uncharacterized protein n=1 Tax=Apiotrichum porosum TaxID=105984 RepID=A0A427XIZ7_9TREE|nr:uncharacterized protein EHS24_001668 [Apiotrichum porosum]RSH78762.1 hypothetical protein EHS24_001668 [Apiotrichum porosum]
MLTCSNDATCYLFGAREVISFCHVLLFSDRSEVTKLRFPKNTFQRLVLNVGTNGAAWFSKRYLVIINRSSRSSKASIVCKLATAATSRAGFTLHLQLYYELAPRSGPIHFTIVNLDETCTATFGTKPTQERFAKHCIQVAVGPNLDDWTEPCTFDFLTVDDYRKTVSDEQFQLETVRSPSWWRPT